MARLDGTVALSGLPPRRGLIVNLCFFAVGSSDAPAPYGGNPPGNAARDCEKLFEETDLNREWPERGFECPFSVTRSTGYYYLQLRVILFREQAGKMFAQAEQFFFGRRTIQLISDEAVAITLPVTWPAIPLEELPRYGTISPRPWWKFW